jgi:integrase
MLRLEKRTWKRKDGTEGVGWRIEGTIHGIDVRESAGTHDRAVAKARLAQRTAEVTEEARSGKKLDCTFAEAVDRYISGRGQAIAKAEFQFVAPLVEEFGEELISSMTPVDVDSYAKARLPTAKGSSVKRMIYDPLNAIINYAADRENGTPICMSNKFKAPSFKATKRVNAPDSWFDKILPYVKNERLATLMLFCTYTGARCGEALAVTPDDIHFDRNRVLLHQSKTETERFPVMQQVLMDKLAVLVRKKKHGRPLFGFSNQRAVNHAMRRLVHRINKADPELHMPYFSSHQWGRKQFATRHLLSGQSLKFVAEAGGWSDIRMPAKHYAHLEQSDIDEGMMKTKLPETREVKQIEQSREVRGKSGPQIPPQKKIASSEPPEGTPKKLEEIKG